MNNMVQAVDIRTDLPSLNHIKRRYCASYHLNVHHVHSAFLTDFVRANCQCVKQPL
jgi:hypothetical protein